MFLAAEIKHFFTIQTNMTVMTSAPTRFWLALKKSIKRMAPFLLATGRLCIKRRKGYANFIKSSDRVNFFFGREMIRFWNNACDQLNSWVFASLEHEHHFSQRC